MKSMRTLFVAILAACSLPGMAQFANNTGTSKSSSVSRGDFPKTYNNLKIGYNAGMLQGKYVEDLSGIDDEESMLLNGFGVQYTCGVAVSKKFPVYVDFGLRMSMGMWSTTFDEMDDDFEGYENAEDTKFKISKLSLAVPVNVSYRVAFNNGATAFVPYTGLHVKMNLMGKESLSYKGNDKAWEALLESAWGQKLSKSVDFFDKKDVGKDMKWKRAQIGWQIGAMLTHKAFNFGVEYSLDFGEMSKKISSSDVLVSVGCNF